MAIVNEEDGFTQLDKLNLLQTLLIQGEPVIATSELLSEGQVIKFDAATNSFVYAGATVDETTGEWTFDKSINVPSGTINVSDTLSISEATLALFIRDNVLKQNFVGVQSSIDETGTSLPFMQEANSVVNVVAQPDDSITITTNPLLIPILASFDNETDSIVFRAASAMANVRLTLTDISTGVILKYLPTKVAVTSGTGGMDFVVGDNIVNMASDDADTPGVFNVGFTPLRLRVGELGSVLIEADTMALLGNASDIPYLENDLHQLFTTSMARRFDTSNIADDYLRLNNTYTVASSTPVGIVTNYLAEAEADTVTGGQFTAGVAATSNPTVITDGSGTFAQGDLVQFKDSVLNSGIFEVEDHTGTTLEVRGVGTVATVEGFTKDDFIATVSDATITKINVSVLRAGTDGNWEVGKGSQTGLTFTNLMFGPGGADTNVQFNNAGVIDGSSDFTWDGSKVDVTGSLDVSGLINSLSLETGNTSIAITLSSIGSSLGARSVTLGDEAGPFQDAASADNTFIGFCAGGLLTTSTGNTLIGAKAGGAFTTQASGDGNSFIGKNTGAVMTAGQDNTVLGVESADIMTNGSFNTLIGDHAANNMTQGDRNIILGNNIGTPNAIQSDFMSLGNTIYADLSNDCVRIGGIAGTVVAGPEKLFVEGGDAVIEGRIDATNLPSRTNEGTFTDSSRNFFSPSLLPASITTASDNISIGVRALDAVISADQNVAIGVDSLSALTAGDGNNIGVGFETGKVFTDRNSVFIGNRSSERRTTGESNITIGSASGRGDGVTAPTGDDNILIGVSTAINITAAANTVALGDSSFQSLTTGTQNISHGNSCGNLLETGSSNILIGHGVNVPTAATSDFLSINSTIFGDTLNNNVRIGGSGVVAGPEALRVEGDTVVTGRVDSNNLPSQTGQGVFTDSLPSFYSPEPIPGSITGISNIGIGVNAANSVTTGFHNIALGKDTLSNVTDGSNNLAIGVDAGRDYAAGGDNSIFIGDCAATLRTGGDRNIAIGPAAGKGDGVTAPSGASNLLIGTLCANQITTGSQNVLIGDGSFNNLTTAIENVAIGNLCGDALTTGTSNILLGHNINVPSGSSNGFLSIGNTIFGDVVNDLVRIGGGSGAVAGPETLNVVGDFVATGTINGLRFEGNVDTATTSDNVYIGRLFPVSLLGGANSNIAIGAGALDSITTNDFNIAIGTSSLANLDGGNSKDNAALGRNTGLTLVTGNNNLFLGIGTDAPDATTSNFTNINNVIFADSSSGFVRIGGGTVDLAGPEALNIKDGTVRIEDDGVLSFPTAQTGGDALVVSGDGDTGITIYAENDSSSSIFFGDQDLNDSGFLQFDHLFDKFELGVPGTVIFEAVSTQADFNVPLFVESNQVATQGFLVQEVYEVADFGAVVSNVQTLTTGTHYRIMTPISNPNTLEIPAAGAVSISSSNLLANTYTCTRASAPLVQGTGFAAFDWFNLNAVLTQSTSRWFDLDGSGSGFTRVSRSQLLSSNASGSEGGTIEGMSVSIFTQIAVIGLNSPFVIIDCDMSLENWLVQNQSDLSSTFFDLQTTTEHTLEFRNCKLVPRANETVFDISSGTQDANSRYLMQNIISSTDLYAKGTFFDATGLDETDPRVVSDGNFGEPSTMITSAGNLAGNSTETVIPAVDAIVLAADSTWTFELENRFTGTSDGISTYTGLEPRTISLDANLSLEPVTATKQIVARHAIIKAALTVVTFTNGTNIVNETAHSLTNGDLISFLSTAGTLPAELRTDIIYYVVNANVNDFQVSYTLGGAAVTFTDDGSGTNSYSLAELHGSRPTEPIQSASPRDLVLQSMAQFDTGDKTGLFVVNADDAVNIIVSEAYARFRE